MQQIGSPVGEVFALKISEIKAYALRHKLEKPFAYSQAWYDTRTALVVKVVTDEGLVGYGESFGPPEPTRAVIEHVLSPLLLGRSPLDTVVLWEAMYNKMRDYGQKGIPIAALSAIDIALWDLKGRILGQPIHQLLGGAFRTRVEAYATGMYFTHTENLTNALAEEAASYVAQGFLGVKMKIGLTPTDDIANVRAVRQAVGPQTKLMIDANHAYDAATAIHIGRALEEQNLYWFEEPVVPEDHAGYLQVKAAVQIPLAGGEAEFTRFGFRNFIAARAVDIVQPDCCLAGGITEGWNIVMLANTFGLRCVPHAWGSAVSLAAALQLLAAMPHCPPSLHPVEPMLEFDCTRNPFREELATRPFKAEDGYVTVPTGPGLGIEVDEAALRRWQAE